LGLSANTHGRLPSVIPAKLVPAKAGSGDPRVAQEDGLCRAVGINPDLV